MNQTIRWAIGPLLALSLSTSLLVAGCSPEPAAVAPPPRPIEPRGPIIEALDEPDGFKRIQKLSLLLPLLGPEAVPYIADALEDPSVDIGAAEIELLTRAWAMHEPAKALGYASTKPPIGLRIAATMPAVELWAKQDPHAALKAIAPLMLVSSMNTKALQVALVRGWYDSGQGGLLDYLRSLGPSFEAQRASAVYARRMIQREGVEAAMRWAESISDDDPKFKLAVFRQVASELAKADPAAGVAWCEAHCEGPYGSKILMMVGMRWAAQDGPAALEWLSKAPAGKVRDAAIRDSYRRWVQRDPDEAYGWAASIGIANAEPWFGPVAEIYAMRLSWKQPREAMDWVALIQDEERRELEYITIARRWRENDESAAEAWVAESPLSDEARDKARQPPKRNAVPGRKGKQVGPPVPEGEEGEAGE